MPALGHLLQNSSRSNPELLVAPSTPLDRRCGALVPMVVTAAGSLVPGQPPLKPSRGWPAQRSSLEASRGVPAASPACTKGGLGRGRNLPRDQRRYRSAPSCSSRSSRRSGRSGGLWRRMSIAIRCLFPVVSLKGSRFLWCGWFWA
eukprot:scaffold935_cov248-Pinguiococcus_pyrenoidosus.AAC.3